MEDSILISINPQWCELIANGLKTIEVRLSAPKLKPPFKCYIYCTRKGKNLIYYGKNPDGDPYMSIKNGKVIGEFVCEKVSKYLYVDHESDPGVKYYDITTAEGEATALSYNKFENYGKGRTLFGWHISNLVIYKEPLPLEAFNYLCCGDCDCCNYSYYSSRGRYFYDEPVLSCDNTIKRPPQSWCYCQIAVDNIEIALGNVGTPALMFKEAADKINK